MRSTHTPGPWLTMTDGDIVSAVPQRHSNLSPVVAFGCVGEMRDEKWTARWEANAAHIVACVNALEGHDPSKLGELVAAAERAAGSATEEAERNEGTEAEERLQAIANSLRAALAAFREGE